MKKILLTSILSILVIGSAFSQIRWGTYNANTNIGQTLKAINTSDKDTLLLDFVTSPTTPVSAWAKAKAAANLGKDSVYKKTLQTQRGLEAKGYYTPTATSQIDNGSFKCRNAANTENPGRVANVDSLMKYLTHSVITGTVNGSTSDSLTRPAACVFDYGVGDIAFGMWPGRCTRIEYLFRFDYTGKSCVDDLTFDMWTYNAGTTGKTATYELAVYKSSTFTDANRIGNKVNIYTTGDPRKTVSLAASIGLNQSVLSNNQLYIVIKTLGTNNDGIANPVDASNIPTLYDPTIVFDNFVATYGASSWSVPTGVVTNAVINHNNGSPVFAGVSSTDYSGGTPTPVVAGVDTPISFYVTGKDRLAALTITEANDGGGHAAGYSIAETGAIKKKDASGNYTIDVAYTRAIDATTGKYSVTIAAPTSGSANDTLQIQVLANVPALATRTIRLELTNGIRFWYNIAANASLFASNNEIDLNSFNAYCDENVVYVTNTTEKVHVYQLNGQLVKLLNTNEASNGFTLPTGLYILKSGLNARKLMVK